MLTTDLAWAPLRVTDAAEYAALLTAVELVDDMHENYSTEDVEEELGDPSRDLSRDTWAVRDDGRLIAAGGVIGSSAVWEVHNVHVFGAVHPQWRRRGIGTQLLAAQLERAAALHAERHPSVPGQLSVGVADHVEGGVALVRAAGLEPTRVFHEMQRDLRIEAPEPTDPAAPLRVVDWDPARDDEVRRAHNLAFRDHWGSTERDAAAWKQWFTGSRNFHGELSRLVLDDTDRLQAYLLGYFYDADEAATGLRDAYIGQIGTLPGARGKGAGTALLTHALTAYRALGYHTSSLGVDTENVTRALGLYERVGFGQTRSSTAWTRTVPARPAG
ncbi:MAG: GNAT family N-acetyltransferase [Geodermatophilaceae bacterium]|nr:GNAT family N-acetyltransferase [Geodermatophilaceae bacterium]